MLAAVIYMISFKAVVNTVQMRPRPLRSVDNLLMQGGVRYKRDTSTPTVMVLVAASSNKVITIPALERTNLSRRAEIHPEENHCNLLVFVIYCVSICY